MKTIILLIPTADNALVTRARRLAIEYLGTRALYREQCYVTGALGLNITLLPKEKRELKDIMCNQNIEIVFLECKIEEIEAFYKSEKLYIDAKLSV